MISDEYNNINEEVNLQLNQILGIVCDIEVTLISHDGKTRCLDEHYPEAIEFIGVTFKGLENPVLKDIISRLTNLETEVKSLETEVKSL